MAFECFICETLLASPYSPHQQQHF